MRNDGGVTRRSILRGAAGGTAATLSLSAVGSAGAQESPDVEKWLSETGNYDGTVVDRTGQDEVTIDVGAPGNEGNLAFGPAAVRIDPGTTVTWEWTGKGGPHNVQTKKGPANLDSGQPVPDEGTTYQHTFEAEGVTTYYCNPHRTLGMKGAIVVGDIQVGGGAVRPDFGGWLAESDGGYEDARGQEEVIVDVGAPGNDGNLAFSPAGLWIEPGTTVRWEWTGQGGPHNVLTEEGPADLDSGQAVPDEGTTYEHTFEEGGITTYYCNPHRTLGMKGAVAVGDDVPTVAAGDGGDVGDDVGDDPGDEAGGDSGFALPGGQPEISILLATFGITAVAVFSVLASEYRGALGGTADAEEPAWPSAEDGIEREIDHDEFDPTGTASLIALYFLILVGLWFFMYFVEFLGNGPTVIG
ncbi:MAG: halocyanin domain-containing protein [Halobacteriales archaeon]